MHIGGRKVDIAALIFGGALLLVGGYYLLVNTFGVDLPELDWDQIWPIALVVLGLVILLRAVQSRGATDRPVDKP
jgi:TRAP-type C4-dicarboxylate transport system permease small subunit